MADRRWRDVIEAEAAAATRVAGGVREAGGRGGTVCVRACVRASERACVRVRVCARARACRDLCVCVRASERKRVCMLRVKEKGERDPALMQRERDRKRERERERESVERKREPVP